MVEQARLAFGAPAVQFAPELLDQQRQGGDPRLGVGRPGLGRRRPRFRLRCPRLGFRGLGFGLCSPCHGIGKGGPEGFGIEGGAAGRRSFHGRQESHPRPPGHPQSGPSSQSGAGQPARDGRQVSTGLRQSIPSSM